MTSPVTGQVAEFIQTSIATGFVNKFEQLSLNTTYTAYTGHTCDVKAVGMVIPTPITKAPVFELAGGEIYDPWDIPGRLRAPVGRMLFSQDFKISGDQIAVGMFLAHLSGLVGVRATLMFSGMTTDSTYNDVYGPKRCKARMLPISGYVDRSLRRVTYTNPTHVDVTCTWRQLDNMQGYTP